MAHSYPPKIANYNTTNTNNIMGDQPGQYAAVATSDRASKPLPSVLMLQLFDRGKPVPVEGSHGAVSNLNEDVKQKGLHVLPQTFHSPYNAINLGYENIQQDESFPRLAYNRGEVTWPIDGQMPVFDGACIGTYSEISAPPFHNLDVQSTLQSLREAAGCHNSDDGQGISLHLGIVTRNRGLNGALFNALWYENEGSQQRRESYTIWIYRNCRFDHLGEHREEWQPIWKTKYAAQQQNISQLMSTSQALVVNQQTNAPFQSFLPAQALGLNQPATTPYQSNPAPQAPIFNQPTTNAFQHQHHHRLPHPLIMNRMPRSSPGTSIASKDERQRRFLPGGDLAHLSSREMLAQPSAIIGTNGAEVISGEVLLHIAEDLGNGDIFHRLNASLARDDCKPIREANVITRRITLALEARERQTGVHKSMLRARLNETRAQNGTRERSRLATLQQQRR